MNVWAMVPGQIQKLPTMGGFHVTIHEDDLCSFEGRMSALGSQGLVELEYSQQVNSYRGADPPVTVF
jgi:hypothetical protein